MEEEKKPELYPQSEQTNPPSQPVNQELPVQQAASIINEDPSLSVAQQSSDANQFPKKKRKLILLLVTATLLAVLLGVAGYALYVTSQETNTSTGECLITDGIEHCLTVDKSDVSYSDSFTLKSSVTNKGGKTLSKSFPCTNNAPSLIVNGEEVVNSGICLTAISEVNIEPGETIEYEMPTKASVLNEGSNEIATDWAGYKSGSVTISLIVNQADANKVETCSESSDVVSACGQITAHFVDGTTLEQAENTFNNYGLAVITQTSYSGLSYQRDPDTDEMVCKELEGEPGYSEKLGFFSANVPFSVLDETRANLELDEAIEFVGEGSLVFNTEPASCEDS